MRVRFNGAKRYTEAVDSEDRKQKTDDRIMKAIDKFEDLMVFQKAYKVSLEIHKLSLEMPKVEQYALADQVRRASKSICANIAEGFGKQSISKVDFKRYLAIAIGSAEEMRVWIRYCYDLDYIAKSDWERFSDEYRDIAKMLSGLHKKWM